MGAMKYVFMAIQEQPEVQEQLAIDDLWGLPCEPDFPDTRDYDHEPPEGTVFDPDHYVPF
jgi:hypothetical protein